MGYNKVAVKAHDLKFYKENLELRIQREVETDTPFLAPMAKPNAKMANNFAKTANTFAETANKFARNEISIDDIIEEAIQSGEIMGITYGNIGSLIVVK